MASAAKAADPGNGASLAGNSSRVIARPASNTGRGSGVDLMGMRSGTTFKKRQKELARMEKQRDKAARRIQRKAEKLSGASPSTPSDDLGEPPDAVPMPTGE